MLAQALRALLEVHPEHLDDNEQAAYRNNAVVALNLTRVCQREDDGSA